MTYKQFLSALGRRIKGLRLSRKWKPYRLAREAKIDGGQVKAIEAGIHTPELETLDRIAGAFGIGLDELFMLDEVCRHCDKSKKTAKKTARTGASKSAD